MIGEFKGEYDWLSNFYPSMIWIEVPGIYWRSSVGHWETVEHAYQAAKTDVREEVDAIWRADSPGKAKKLGRRCTMRPDWDAQKVDVMRMLLKWKFDQHPDLKAKLIETGDQYLEEGNWWKDRFWGVCPVGSGNGKNMLGILLMELRQSY